LKNSKKILFIHHGSIPGGSPTSLANTIIGLQRFSDFEIKILCCHDSMKAFFKEKTGLDPGDIYSPFLILGRVMIGWASIFNLKTLYLLVREIVSLPISFYRQALTLRSESPAIVHLNSSILLITAICVKLLRLPLVWHVREVIVGGKFNVRKRLTGWIIRTLADRVITISPVEAASLGKDRKGNVQVVYNFIDFGHFDPALINLSETKKKFGVDQDDHVVLSLGGASFRKGAYQILCASKEINRKCKILLAGPPLKRKDRNKGTRLLIRLFLKIEQFLCTSRLKSYYSWFYEDRLQNEIKSISDDRIRFIGQIDDVVPLIAISDILVFAGTTPHFPRPVYEAWAMKKPVVIFDVEGVSPNISEGYDGVIVRNHTGTALAQKLNEILGNKSLLQQFGENGYRKAKDRFDIDKNIFEIITTYQKILDQIC